MALTEPKAKKNVRLRQSQPLPAIEKSAGGLCKLSGRYNGFSVVVEDGDEMKQLISMGYFGKANLSRAYPQFLHDDKTEIVRRRVLENRKKLCEKLQVGKQQQKVIVVPDSDEEDTNNERYFTNLRPEYQIDKLGLKEKVQLALEEAFFLAAEVECLEISYEAKKLDINEIWNLFTTQESHFLINYVVYYYFRAKNWVVKPGIKFGGDYLLYKQGPPFYHASYVVIIRVVDCNYQEIEKLTRHALSIVHLMGLSRLCETSGKELLICDVVCPDNIENLNYKNLDLFSIKETIMKRWIPSKERLESGASTSSV